MTARAISVLIVAALILVGNILIAWLRERAEKRNRRSRDRRYVASKYPPTDIRPWCPDPKDVQP